MNWIQRLFKGSRDLTADLLTFMGLPYGFGTASLSKMQAMQLSTVYRCVEVKSDALAYPTKLIQEYTSNGWVTNRTHDLHNMLNLEPDPAYGGMDLWKLMEAKVELEGNAYCQIIRGPDYMPVSLQLIRHNVRVILDETGILHYLVEAKNPYVVEQSNMLHFKNFSYDGIVGISTLTHANNTLNYVDAAEKHAGGFFFGGANSAVVIKVQGRLSIDQAEKIKQDFISKLNPTDGNPNSAVVVPMGMDVTPVSINPRDAQMLESREYNITEICRFFGVDPTKVYHTKDSKYNTVESMQLAWLTDTIAPRFTQRETELNRKLFMPSVRRSLRIRYDVEDLLRADMDSLANYRMKLTQVGSYTVDDNREAVGKPKFNTRASKTAMVQVNMQPVDNLFKDDGKGSAQPGQ